MYVARVLARDVAIGPYLANTEKDIAEKTVIEENMTGNVHC